MYWWNVSKLAEDLREGRVDEKERFKYFLATFVAWNILVLVLINSGVPFDVDRLISAAVNLTVAIIGIILCYRINKKGDDTDFVGRMICLGWPLGVRFVVIVSSPILFILFMVAVGATSGTTIADNLRKLPGIFWGSITPGIFILLPYFLSMKGHLASVAHAGKGQSDPRWASAALSNAEIVLAFAGGVGALVIFMFGFMDSPRLVGLRSLGELLTYSASFLWFLLFFLIIRWSQERRATKQISHTNQ